MNRSNRARHAPKLRLFTVTSARWRAAVSRGYGAFLMVYADDADAPFLQGRRMARGLVCGTPISLALWAVLLWGVFC